MTKKKSKRSPAKKPRNSAHGPKLTLHPKILIFDIDGVLIDVRATYWRSAIETVRHLSGKRVTYADLHKWKAKPERRLANDGELGDRSRQTDIL
jgi:phosphoglycolate phosphatase-like HAD superfamily hydrolase